MSAFRHIAGFRGSRMSAIGLLALALIAGAASSQEEPAALEGEPIPSGDFAITSETGHILFVLQEQWEQWQGAYRLGDRDGGEQALTLMLEALNALGMDTIPEYARAAAGLALKASSEGRFEQARWALETAERLDPLVSEAAFARSALRRAEGEWMPAMANRVDGYLRIWSTPLRRIVWVNDLLTWMLAVGLLTCGLFVIVEAAAKGGGVYSGLVRMFRRWVPAPWAHGAALATILWPILLPGGPIWLLIYWSVLLWAFSSPSEKAILVLAWLLLGFSPMLLERQRQRLSLAGSAASRALEGLDSRRLEGTLLTDLGVLSSTLPNDPAVDQLLGDVNRRFGQWEQAREHYIRVLDEEPENVSALINLGVYYFLSADFESAEETFRRAAELSPNSAVPYYNLSETYSSSYAFGRAEQNLIRARQADASAVDRWIQREEGSRPVAVNGGLERTGEIRSRLYELWKRTGLLLTWDEMLSRTRSLPFAMALLGAAIGVGWLRRKAARMLIVRPSVEAGSTLDRWRRILLPGLGSAELGRGLTVFATLLPPAFLVSLPVTRQLGYPIPWALDPGSRPIGMAAAAAFALWFAWHLWRQLRGRRPE